MNRLLIHKNTYKDIESFIEHMKQNEDVIGIVEYGGRTYTDMSLGGDYDLTIIFNKPISKNFSGVHFHINGIPVDCMLLSVEDFMSKVAQNEFYLVHLNCNILYDQNHITADIIKKIQIAWSTPKVLSDFEIMLFRFTFTHILDKLRHRLHDHELYAKYFIYAQFEWFLSSYARIKNWEVGKPKLHLKLIETHEPILYEIITNLYLENHLDAQFELLSQCANYMIEPIGGLWKEDEVLFHLNPLGIHDEEEQNKFLNVLMKHKKD